MGNYTNVAEQSGNENTKADENLSATEQPTPNGGFSVNKRLKADYVLVTDADLKVIEANGQFMERHKDVLIIGRTLCQIFDITALGACPAETCVNCPVKRSLRTMAPVEVEMRVKGRLQQWRAFPFMSKGSFQNKALVHIKDLS